MMKSSSKIYPMTYITLGVSNNIFSQCLTTEKLDLKISLKGEYLGSSYIVDPFSIFVVVAVSSLAMFYNISSLMETQCSSTHQFLEVWSCNSGEGVFSVLKSEVK